MRSSVKAILFAAFSTAICSGQTFTLDTTFNAGATGSLSETVGVHAMAVQPDGKIVIAGAFTEVAGLSRSGIARLNADGTLDQTFDPGTGFDGAASCLLLLPGEKVLVGGIFNMINGWSYPALVQLNADGSVDPSWGIFPTTVVSRLSVERLVLHPDGDVLVGGFFTHINGVTRVCVAKVSTDSVLREFNPRVNNVVLGFLPDTTGKITLGGGFTTVAGAAQPRVTRVLTSGAAESSFNARTGPDSLVFWVGNGGGEKVLVGGMFGNVNGTTRKGLARLGADGALDTSFDAQLSGEVVLVAKTLQSTGGKTFVAGLWERVSGLARPSLVRLNADGSPDASFDAGFIDDGVNDLAFDAEGNLLVSGYFNQIGGVPIAGIARFKRAALPQAPGLQARKVAGEVVVSTPSEAGFTYRLEKREILEAGSWATVEQLAGSGGELTFAPVAAAGSSGFFRVVAE